jgi:hypothetical protein
MDGTTYTEHKDKKNNFTDVCELVVVEGERCEEYLMCVSWLLLRGRDVLD